MYISSRSSPYRKAALISSCTGHHPFCTANVSRSHISLLVRISCLIKVYTWTLGKALSYQPCLIPSNLMEFISLDKEYSFGCSQWYCGWNQLIWVSQSWASRSLVPRSKPAAAPPRELSPRSVSLEILANAFLSFAVPVCRIR